MWYPLRLESELGREGKLGHPTFRALWQRSLDFMAGTAEAYGEAWRHAGITHNGSLPPFCFKSPDMLLTSPTPSTCWSHAVLSLQLHCDTRGGAAFCHWCCQAWRGDAGAVLTGLATAIGVKN